MTILIRSTLKKNGLHLRGVRERLKKMIRAARLGNVEVSVLFVGDRAMRSLNRRYRRKDRTTDVLSFPFHEGAKRAVRPELLGDIVIAVPVAERQACDAGTGLAAEIDRLLVHGLLHLVGYDHERGPLEAKRMERRERELLEALGA